MADDADLAAVIIEQELERQILAAREPIPAGVPGDCENCGDESPRLVAGWCAPCRDGRRRVLRRVA